MTFFFDPTIERKSRIVDGALKNDDAGIPLPSVVEVSESGTCNRKCAFCPRSDPGYPDIKEFIDPGLIDKLSGQLDEVGFQGIFLFSGFVEPLLDKNIYDLVGIVRGNLSGGRVEMVTNGDVLDRERLRRLFESGLSTLLISAYDGPEQAEGFEALCREAGLRDDQYVVRKRYLPPEEDFGITLSNRAGMMDHAEFNIPVPEATLKHPCFYPHYTFFMDYLGDVLLCPHDWGKKLIVGNMKTQNFKDLWLSPGFATARRRLIRGDRGFDPCRVCDVKGTLMGKDHAKAWNTLDKRSR